MSINTKVDLRIFTFDNIYIAILFLDDPRTKPIVTGKETWIEIDRGQSGLGLSVVGGSDTQLVSIDSSLSYASLFLEINFRFSFLH